MLEKLFNFLVDIPKTLANMGEWLVSPISEKFLNISPLGLLGIGGTAVLISLIVVHVVKLFI